ncbi:MAG: hypothetical protein IKE29_16275 [Paenibacillus sp.]|uniref:hypothetical protein n=1 Tax=Paenibacillus sp. TaxID=58172 RepID=UPI0025E27B7F|nr:hypothetical protein [Paenibacillus sp.]MBR2566161.1 hypothetical protein [Paenibacillus sp.]
MSDLISRLSELRSQYNCFNENEREAYHALSEAIEALREQRTGKWRRHPIYEGSDHYYYACSECDYRSWSQDNYCSVCGAKMEVKDG